MKKLTLSCGQFTVRVSVYANRLDTAINGQNVPMIPVAAASGAKYEGISGDVALSLWSKGETWMMLINENQVIECRVTCVPLLWRGVA